MVCAVEWEVEGRPLPPLLDFCVNSDTPNTMLELHPMPPCMKLHETEPRLRILPSLCPSASSSGAGQFGSKPLKRGLRRPKPGVCSVPSPPPPM